MIDAFNGDKPVIDAFNSLCEFRVNNPGIRGSAIYSNDKIVIGVKKDLQLIETWLREKFQNYRGINLDFDHSKGIGYFPSVLHVSILPPGQQVSKGVYVVICFDLYGRGALVGCAESKTNPQGLNTIKRTRTKNLQIDVNGLRQTTKYNDTFENPKEFFNKKVNIEELKQHLTESLELCLYHLKLIQNPELNIGALVNANSEYEFNPRDISYAKEKIATYIAYRRGQKKFRDKLLEVYNERCVISNCNVNETLEAAHIIPYQGVETNDVQNGLLFRSDIHTLFDLSLLTIDASNYMVRVSKKLRNTIYEVFQGQRINLPIKKEFYPSKKALQYHNDQFKD